MIVALIRLVAVEMQRSTYIQEMFGVELMNEIQYRRG